MRRLVRALDDENSDDTGPDAETPEDTAGDAEYAFDGYDVDFSTKVMLTPAASPPSTPPRTATAQSRRR
jgi:hypothetical protein